MSASRGSVALGYFLLLSASALASGCAVPAEESADEDGTVDTTHEAMICTTCPGVPPTPHPPPPPSPTLQKCEANKIAIQTHYWDVGPVNVTLYRSPSCVGYSWAEVDALSTTGGSYNVWIDDEQHDHDGLRDAVLNAWNGYTATSALVSLQSGMRACVSVNGALDQFSRVGCTDYH